MTQGSSWFSWFTFPYFAPLSGAVTQDLSRHGYRGVPEIEADVIQNAGSFGRQLGILSEAVIELADRLGKQDAALAGELVARAEGAGESALEKLRTLVIEVDEIKERHKTAARREAADALKRLRTVDPDGYERLQASLRLPEKL